MPDIPSRTFLDGRVELHQAVLNLYWVRRAGKCDETQAAAFMQARNFDSAALRAQSSSRFDLHEDGRMENTVGMSGSRATSELVGSVLFLHNYSAIWKRDLTERGKSTHSRAHNDPLCSARFASPNQEILVAT